jgi:hypothetical protein
MLAHFYCQALLRGFGAGFLARWLSEPRTERSGVSGWSVRLLRAKTRSVRGSDRRLGRKAGAVATIAKTPSPALLYLADPIKAIDRILAAFTLNRNDSFPSVPTLNLLREVLSMPPKKNAGESKQGLVITLVFFILTTIGLGVGTYYGFADQEALKQKAKGAEDKEKVAVDLARYRRFQTLQLRVFFEGRLSPQETEEFQSLRGQFDNGKLGASEKDKQAFVTLVQELDKKLGWDAALKKPKTIFPGLIAAEQQKVATLQTQLKQMEDLKKKADAAKDAAVAELENAQKQYTDKLTTITQNLQKDNKLDLQNIAALKAEIGRLGEQLQKKDKDIEQERVSGKKAVFDKEKEITSLRGKLADLSKRFADARKNTVEAPREWRTDWKIIRVSDTGLNPYINLGMADNVRPGLTFSVHGVALDGKPQPVAKATIEVVSPIEAHLSRARVTAVRDGDDDPIQEGDILYNPSWDPQLKKHIALTGVIDLNGDGRDDTAEFVRALQKQNILVDSYLDTSTLKTKGAGMTLRTDYLVIGEGRGALRQSRNAAFLDSLDKAITAARKEATKNGVPLVSLYRYLEMIGYRLPKSVDKQPGSTGRGNRPATRSTPRY